MCVRYEKKKKKIRECEREKEKRERVSMNTIVRRTDILLPKFCFVFSV